MKRKAGLSLVELLVVLFVILLLTLLSLPAILRARESARTTQCANNMHQLLINDTARADRELLLICPADPTGQQRIKQNGTSYPRNRAIDFSDTKLALSKTIVKFEAADEYTEGSVDPRDWFEGDKDRNWPRIQETIAPQRHVNAVANYLYADGHVAAIPAEQIRDWADQGTNFGLLNRGSYIP